MRMGKDDDDDDDDESDDDNEDDDDDEDKERRREYQKEWKIYYEKNIQPILSHPSPSFSPVILVQLIPSHSSDDPSSFFGTFLLFFYLSKDRS